MSRTPNPPPPPRALRPAPPPPPSAADRVVASVDSIRESIRATLASDAAFLDEMADRLDGWAKQSRGGGWSTHQVDANVAAANDCRRRAAEIRQAIATMMDTK